MHLSTRESVSVSAKVDEEQFERALVPSPHDLFQAIEMLACDSGHLGIKVHSKVNTRMPSPNQDSDGSRVPPRDGTKKCLFLSFILFFLFSNLGSLNQGAQHGLPRQYRRQRNLTQSSLLTFRFVTA